MQNPRRKCSAAVQCSRDELRSGRVPHTVPYPGVAKVVTCWGHNFVGDYNRGHFEFVHVIIICNKLIYAQEAKTVHYYCMTCVIQKTKKEDYVKINSVKSMEM